MTDNVLYIALCSCTALGLLHSVDAISPLQTKPVEKQTPQASDNSDAPPVQQLSAEPQGEPMGLSVDLSHLSEDQQQQVYKMLKEQCDVCKGPGSSCWTSETLTNTLKISARCSDDSESVA